MKSNEPRKYLKLSSHLIWLEPRPNCRASECSCSTASTPIPTTWCALASFTRNHTKSAAYCDWNRTSKLRWAWLEHEHEFEAVAAKNSLCLDKCLGSVWRLPENPVGDIYFGDAWTSVHVLHRIPAETSGSAPRTGSNQTHSEHIFAFLLQMFRLTVRASKEHVTTEICELLGDQF